MDDDGCWARFDARGGRTSAWLLLVAALPVVVVTFLGATSRTRSLGLGLVALGCGALLVAQRARRRGSIAIRPPGVVDLRRADAVPVDWDDVTMLGGSGPPRLAHAGVVLPRGAADEVRRHADWRRRFPTSPPPTWQGPRDDRWVPRDRSARVLVVIGTVALALWVWAPTTWPTPWPRFARADLERATAAFTFTRPICSGPSAERFEAHVDWVRSLVVVHRSDDVDGWDDPPAAPTRSPDGMVEHQHRWVLYECA